MKSIYSLLLLSFLVSCTQSQKIVTPNITITTPYSNIVYLGIIIPIDLVVAPYNKDDIDLVVDNGTITKNNGTYQWFTKNRGSALISIIDKNNKTLIKSKKFKVKRFPSPTARLGKEDSGHLRSGILKAQGGISTWIEAFDLCGSCKVKNYTMTLVHINQDIIKITNQGGKFETTTKELLQTIKTGDILLFDKIRTLCPGDENSRRVNDLIFWVD